LGNIGRWVREIYSRTNIQRDRHTDMLIAVLRYIYCDRTETETNKQTDKQTYTP